VTNTAYLVGFRGHRRLVAICVKFAAVSCRMNLANSILVSGIWKKIAAENCGP